MVLGIVLIALTILFLENRGTLHLFNKDVENESSNTADGVNYGPPTKQEQEAGDIKKQQIVDENKEIPDVNNATLVITDAEQYDNEIEVRAFVSNVIKDGDCNIKFTSGENEINKQVPAYEDASTTPCIALSIPRNEFPVAGTWQVEVTYTSKNNDINAYAQTEMVVR